MTRFDPRTWRDYRAIILKVIGGTRAELDVLPWDEFCREYLAALRLIPKRGRS